MRAFLIGFGSGTMDIVGILLGILALSVYPLFPEHMLPAASQLFLIGIVLILGAFAGHLASRFSLPRITGYILIGILINPTLPGIVPDMQLPVLVEMERTQGLSLINDLAIGLIAMMAGAEIRLLWLRARLRAILSVTLVSTIVTPTIIGGFLLFAPQLGLPDIPFMTQAMDVGVPGLAIAALVGAILLANSPTVVVSILKEMRADGPMGQTVMGVSVIMDAVVILMFTILMALIAVMGAGAGEQAPSLMQASGAVAGSIVFSIVVGGVIGFGVKHYTEWSDHRLSWT
jgi:Kef-type K+ transport system membrane component KefB